MAKVLCEACGTNFLYDVVKDMKVCPVCGKPLFSDEDHSDWITWYYYGHKSDNGKTASLREEPIDLNEHGDIFFLIKEFKAPPRDASGSAERAKEVLRTYIPGAFVFKKAADDVVRCPWCQSTEIQMVPRKFSLLTGFATNKVDRVCVKCGRKF